MVGECGTQPRMDHTLRSHIGLGHGVHRTLETNLAAIPKGCADQRSGLMGNIDGNCEDLRCRQRGFVDQAQSPNSDCHNPRKKGIAVGSGVNSAGNGGSGVGVRVAAT